MGWDNYHLIFYDRAPERAWPCCCLQINPKQGCLRRAVPARAWMMNNWQKMHNQTIAIWSFLKTWDTWADEGAQVPVWNQPTDCHPAASKWERQRGFCSLIRWKKFASGSSSQPYGGERERVGRYCDTWLFIFFSLVPPLLLYDSTPETWFVEPMGGVGYSWKLRPKISELCCLLHAPFFRRRQRQK